MPGVKSYGFHEGSRSEYLAQYAFASWGTAVVVPQQEDHGLDLHCTLMEQIGGRWLAKSPYTVQVKSEMKPVEFKTKEEVRWVIEHPLPLFLCIANKTSARLSIYHTLARFHAWCLGQWPDQLSMIPMPAIPDQEGKCIDWPGSYDLSLDQPILDFSVTEMLDEVFWRKMRAVFEYWIEVENDNLTRVRTGSLSCRVPAQYKTNDAWMTGQVTRELLYPNDAQFDRASGGLNEPIAWVGEQFLRKGDLEGAAKAALLHRHLFPDVHGGLFYRVQDVLNKRVGRASYVYAGVDFLAEVIQKALKVNGEASGNDA